MQDDKFSLIMCELAKIVSLLERLEAKTDTQDIHIGSVGIDPVDPNKFSRFADLSSIKLEGV